MLRKKPFAAPTTLELKTFLLKWKFFTSVCAQLAYLGSPGNGVVVESPSEAKSQDSAIPTQRDESGRNILEITSDQDLESLRSLLTQSSASRETRKQLFYPPKQLCAWVAEDVTDFSACLFST